MAVLEVCHAWVWLLWLVQRTGMRLLRELQVVLGIR